MPVLGNTQWKVYEDHRKAHLKLVSQRRTKMFEEFLDKLSTMNFGEMMRTISAIKKKRSGTKKIPLKTDPVSMRSYSEHYGAQFRNDNPPGEPLVPLLNEEMRNIFNLETCFTSDAINLALLDLANGKAAGNSGFPSEVFAVAADVVTLPIQEMFKFAAANHVVPASWRVARIQPIPKKGDLTAIKNYRPISLTEVLRKFTSLCSFPI